MTVYVARNLREVFGFCVTEAFRNDRLLRDEQSLAEDVAFTLDRFTKAENIRFVPFSELAEVINLYYNKDPNDLRSIGDTLLVTDGFFLGYPVPHEYRILKVLSPTRYRDFASRVYDRASRKSSERNRDTLSKLADGYRPIRDALLDARIEFHRMILQTPFAIVD